MLARPHLAAMGLSQRRSMETTTAQVPMEDLLQATEVIKIRKELSMNPGQKLTRLEFCAICGKHGLQEPAALEILEILHKAGVVLNFAKSSSEQLRDTVFIKPQDVLDTVWATLDVSGVTNLTALNKKLDELKGLEKEYKSLSTVKAVLDNAADQEAARNIWIGGSLPVGCLVILFRMTYWEFSWDIVEPISFFVSTMMPIAFFYVWFATNKEDFTLAGWRQQMVEKSQINLYRVRGFDLERYTIVAQAIAECKEDIRVLQAL